MCNNVEKYLFFFFVLRNCNAEKMSTSDIAYAAKRMKEGPQERGLSCVAVIHR